ncbi:hypothetical protein [Streptomyces sp. NPDC052114]|uniref:hypothetical protein n=1 Tax=unclassified Streptomyces TaxID=2593676 RepID=UPI003440E0B3
MRRNTAAVLLTTLLALTGCSDSDPDEPSKTTTATVTATPSLSRAETARQCSEAVAEAAPGWDDWNYSPGGWEDDPRTPKVCLGLSDDEYAPRGNREFMTALIDGLEMADDPRARQ